MTYTESVTIDAVAPFDFELSAQLFSSGDPHVRSFADGCFWQVICVDSKLVLAQVSSVGAIEAPKLSLTLQSNSALSAEQTRKATATVNYIFNLQFPLNAFYEQIKADPIMHPIVCKLYGLKNPTTPTVFEALVDSIIEQQISIKVARTIEHRLAKKLGENLTVNGEKYFAYPTAQNIADAGIDEVRQVGLSQRKAEYIKGAAQFIVDRKLDLEHLNGGKSPEAIIAELDALKGIGVWTAELTMLRGMQRLDALPADDFGIKRVISRYYCSGRPIKAAEARKIALAWGNWKGLAAFYLIIAEAKDLKV
jgi:DNA-3-methyladenine glycosylase II